MLVVMISQPYGRFGAVLSALTVACAVIGLTLHKDFYAGEKRKDFFCFYTNVSNLLVLLYFSLLAPRLYARAALRPFIPAVEFSMMMSIMLTFCVFHTLIFPSVRIAAEHAPHTREYRIAVADNLIIHYIVPWLVFLYWLFCAPGKDALGTADALWWLLMPAAYLVYVLLRAQKGCVIEETGSPYPYPFLDARHFGAGFVLRTCAKLCAICVLAGLGIIAAARLAFALLGGGHALILI